MKVHLKTSLAISKCSKGFVPPILFCLACALMEEDMDERNSQKFLIFKDLWFQKSGLWDYQCLVNALLMCMFFERDDLFEMILRSETAQAIFLNLPLDMKVNFIQKFFENYLDHHLK